MALIGSDSTSISISRTDTRIDETVIAPGSVGGDSFAFSDSAVGTFAPTDLGAISLGLATAEKIAKTSIESSLQAVRGATDAAQIGLKKAGDVLLNQSESDLTKFLMPIVWIFAIIVGGLVAFFFFFKK